MKSAKNKKSIRTTSLLLLIVLSLLSLCVGCGKASFLPSFGKEPSPPSNEDPNEGSTPTIVQPNPTPTYYNRYTGLACDETLLSCRPISVCIGNFDGNRQEGLSFADILIEAPIDGDKTRLWAMSVNPESATKLSSVASVRDYMMPISGAFGAISAYSGTTDTTGASTAVFEGDTLDYLYHNLASTFTKDADGTLFTSGAGLLQAAKGRGYSIMDTNKALPYRFAEVGSTYIPAGNRVSSVHFGFSMANTVSFSYDAQSGLYLRSQASATHTDALTGEQLSFSNVVILFHNVSYYHSANGTTFSLDSASGGNGYAYTGGGVVPISWHFDESGALLLTDDAGETLTLNRGKSYIGMLRVTDSTSLIAK